MADERPPKDSASQSGPNSHAQSAGPLVVAEGVTKVFLHMGTRLEVLKGIDLTIAQGEVLSIVGASGAGKSTLLHCMGTLDVPTSGKLSLAGQELTELSGAKLAQIRNRFVGFVFQFHHLLPEFNALENVMLPGLIGGRSRTEMSKRAKELLELVGLQQRETHRPGELSGGEQQRVAVARALALNPRLLLADEPTGNLDSKTGDAVHDLLFDINREYGTTIVVVTHNPGFAQRMPRVVEMRDGRILADGPGTAYEGAQAAARPTADEPAVAASAGDPAA